MKPVCFDALHSLLYPEIKNTSWDLVSHHCVTYISYILKINHVKGIHKGENEIFMEQKKHGILLLRNMYKVLVSVSEMLLIPIILCGSNLI